MRRIEPETVFLMLLAVWAISLVMFLIFCAGVPEETAILLTNAQSIVILVFLARGTFDPWINRWLGRWFGREHGTR